MNQQNEDDRLFNLHPSTPLQSKQIDSLWSLPEFFFVVPIIHGICNASLVSVLPILGLLVDFWNWGFD